MDPHSLADPLAAMSLAVASAPPPWTNFGHEWTRWSKRARGEGW